MKVSIEWLNDFTPITLAAKSLCDGMTLSGSKVESCDVLGADITKVVIGKITALAKHPDADKLQICQINSGERQLQIVTGATNVQVGDTVPVALDGATLPGGVTIRSGKLRGEQSEGMLCSISELGCTTADFPDAISDGIFILPADAPLGQDVVEYLHLNDTIIDFEITSNRVDCFAVEGLAREAAVTFELPFQPIVPQVQQTAAEPAAALAKIDIAAPDLCYRYCGRVAKNVRVAPSPAWLRRRLRAVGMRPINNIVDITNYVMLELGQPMHAFDLEQLAGRQIIVRRAADGETMRTLDSVDRKLDASMLVIADRDRAVALAGVMGAENSEITSGTTTILLESATFNPIAVRQAAKKVGLRTEASARFEKGLDVYNASRAIDRACELIEQLGIGEICPGTIDVWPVKPKPLDLIFSPEAINAFLGTAIDTAWMCQTLGKLGIKARQIEDSYHAAIPSFRPDLVCEADLAEEIARLYGYNKIEPTLLSGKQTTLGGRSPAQKTLEKIKDLMIGEGFYEACTYSFESPRQLDKLLVPADHALRQGVQILNPLGEDYSLMRTSMMPSILEIAATNWKRSVESARIFEIAFTYQPKSLPLTELPQEVQHLAAFIYNSAADSQGSTFFELKGVMEEVFVHLGLTGIRYQAISDCPFLHPGQTTGLYWNDQMIGFLGIIHPDVADNFGAAPQTAVLDLELASILANSSDKRQYKPLPRFPAVNRDLALLVDAKVSAADLLSVMQAAAGPNLESIRIFDVYQGPQVKVGQKSMAFNLVFRSSERTLNEDDIQPVIQKILEQLLAKCHAILRD